MNADTRFQTASVIKVAVMVEAFQQEQDRTDEEKLPDGSGRRGHIRGDAAIVRTPRSTYVLAIFTRRVNDFTWTADNAALVAGAEISRAIYEAWGK